MNFPPIPGMSPGNLTDKFPAMFIEVQQFNRRLNQPEECQKYLDFLDFTLAPIEDYKFFSSLSVELNQLKLTQQMWVQYFHSLPLEKIIFHPDFNFDHYYQPDQGPYPRLYFPCSDVEEFPVALDYPGTVMKSRRATLIRSSTRYYLLGHEPPRTGPQQNYSTIRQIYLFLIQNGEVDVIRQHQSNSDVAEVSCETDMDELFDWPGVSEYLIRLKTFKMAVRFNAVRCGRKFPMTWINLQIIIEQGSENMFIDWMQRKLWDWSQLEPMLQKFGRGLWVRHRPTE